jgi:hypothetical protein
VWKFKSNILAEDPDIIIFTGDYENTAVFNYLSTRTKKIALTCNLEVRQWGIWIADENT